MTQHEHADRLAAEVLLEQAATLDRQAKEAWRVLIWLYPQIQDALEADDTYEGTIAHLSPKLSEIAQERGVRELLSEIATASHLRELLLERCGLKRSARG